MFVYNSVIYSWGGFQNNTLKDILLLWSKDPWNNKENLLKILLLRWEFFARFSWDSGGAGLVLGPAGDHTNTQKCLRYGE